MKQNSFPSGWNNKRIKETFTHYEAQTEDEAVAEDEAAFDVSDQALMEIPVETRSLPNTINDRKNE